MFNVSLVNLSRPMFNKIVKTFFGLGFDEKIFMWISVIALLKLLKMWTSKVRRDPQCSQQYEMDTSYKVLKKYPKIRLKYIANFPFYQRCYALIIIDSYIISPFHLQVEKAIIVFILFLFYDFVANCFCTC